ncbi:hypothetical protein ALC56_00811 [Trachymyrmex septentrionalis]|uniref:Uncharacterized protein n=1 Tax=Trachymyrmex septentrionalis TaxID=34720 RepID=A0A195FWL1_9HYME|nr:hypothetical protein ALC56_00811 [Trachymyrmex septentrionalis]
MSAQKRLICEPGMAGKIINACANMHNRLNIDHEDRTFQGRTLAERIQKCFIVEDIVKGIN